MRVMDDGVGAHQGLDRAQMRVVSVDGAVRNRSTRPPALKADQLLLGIEVDAFAGAAATRPSRELTLRGGREPTLDGALENAFWLGAITLALDALAARGLEVLSVGAAS